MPVDDEQQEACHWLLLRLAGCAPDDLLTQCRRWTAEGRLADVGRAVTYAVISRRIRLADRDVDLLAELLGAAGVDNSVLSMVDATDIDPMSVCGFAPDRAQVATAPGLAADARPGTPHADAWPKDDVDRAALAAVADHQSTRAMWRAWRYPGDGSPWPPARRVYVVECDVDANLPAITAGMQDGLASAGEVDPQVEVYPTRAPLPSYQRLARTYGALLWARDPDPGLRIATPFDGVVSGLPTLDDSEAERLLAYLRNGEALLVTTGRKDDVVDQSRTGVVPMNFRTDGFWIWTDASTYYLERYRLSPDPLLVAHVRQRDFQPPVVDGVAWPADGFMFTSPTTSGTGKRCPCRVYAAAVLPSENQMDARGRTVADAHAVLRLHVAEPSATCVQVILILY